MSESSLCKPEVLVYMDKDNDFARHATVAVKGFWLEEDLGLKAHSASITVTAKQFGTSLSTVKRA